MSDLRGAARRPTTTELPADSKNWVSMYQRQRVEEGEEMFRPVVVRTLNELNVPTRAEFEALLQRIDDLTRRLEQLTR